MIEFINVDKSYGDKIIDNLTFKLNRGESMGIFGKSGIGKSTIIYLILKLKKPDSGQIISDYEKYSVVFQEDRLIDELPALDNLKLISDDESLIKNSLEKFGIDDYYKKVSEFSGGMKRRTALARAYLFDGEILILDEPFKGLDMDNKTRAASLFKHKFADRSIILVSHNVEDFALFDIKDEQILNL